MASFLSPIMSGGESSSGSDGRDYDTAATIEAPESRRLIAASRNQCRTPSTSSQVSDLDDEVITNDHKAHSGAGGSKPHCQARAASLSSTGSGGSVAQQFLLLHHRNSSSSGNYNPNQQASSNNNHQYSNLYNLKQTKRFKQILQSIPLPLVATSIITVFILCLLLRECKSLQVAQGAVQSLVMEPSPRAPGAEEAQQPRDEDRLVIGGEQSGVEDGESSFRSIKLLRRHQQLPAAHREGLSREMEVPQPVVEGVGDELGLQVSSKAAESEEIVSPRASGGSSTARTHQLTRQQLDLGQLESLNREILRDLMQKHRHQQSRQLQSKRHSDGDVFGQHHYHQHQLAPTGPDTLHSMLAGSGGGDTPSSDKEGGSAQDELKQAEAGNRFLDGEPASSRPANLRSSALELDLSNEQRQQSAANPAPVASALTSASHRYRYQHPSHLQHQHQQQQQNYNNKLNEEHVKSHQPHPIGGNNHDRPFDVYQIQCNNTDEGFELFACPTADNLGRFRCIEDSLFCDGYYDCPGGEDEERVSCMYYKLIECT